MFGMLTGSCRHLPHSFNIVEEAHVQLEDLTMVAMDAKMIA